jgi:transposase
MADSSQVMGREDLPVPWKVSNVFDERVRFVMAALGGAVSMTDLCHAHGISRETGYKWLARYHAAGWDALKDQSRAPLHQAGAMPEAIAAAVLALRRQRPHWGPRKLRAALLSTQPQEVWPAASTLGDLLRREGQVSGAGRRHRAEPVTQPFVAATAPNDLWCIDFKGWFRTGDGRRCDPLTLSDAVSRYLLACEIMAPRAAEVAVACERLFREHGLPGGLRMDNGPPFASSGAGGLTRLSVGWVKLGIRLERITPGCPGQNGRHELRRPRRWWRSRRALTTSDATLTRFAHMRRWARSPLPAATPARGAPTPIASRTPGMTRIIRCGACALTARSCGVAHWCRSPRHWLASRLDLPSWRVAIGLSASPTSHWGW